MTTQLLRPPNGHEGGPVEGMPGLIVLKEYALSVRKCFLKLGTCPKAGVEVLHENASALVRY